MKKFMTRFTAIFAAFLMIVTCAVPAFTADAATYYYSSRAKAGTYLVADMSEYSCGVSVRPSAGYDRAAIATIYPNTAYNIVSTTKDSYGRPWYKINYSGSKTGYVCGYYAHTVSVNDNNYVITPGSSINMRKGPSTTYPSIKNASANTYYSIIGCNCENFGVTGTKWYQCMDNNNNVFWFKSTVVSGVKLKANVTSCDINAGDYVTATYHFNGASYARTSPTTSASKVRSSTFSTKCTVFVSGIVLNTSNEIWYYVTIHDGSSTYKGYVLGTLLK